jgi:peroxiredoxin
VRHKWMLFCLVCCMLGLSSGSAFGQEPPAAKPKVDVGDTAPDFSLRDMEGNLIRLSDIAYSGKEVSWKKKKKVLLDFFRTDCVACMKELPQIVDYHNKHNAEVQVIMIALLEAEEGREKLDRFLEINKLPFPILVDAYETVAKKYIVEGESVTLPSLFMIDEVGSVRARFVGLKEDLEVALQKSLEAPATANK